MRPAILAVALLLTACSTSPQVAQSEATPILVASQWLEQVTEISAGDDTAARGQAIKARLSALGLSPREETFVAGDLKGNNILADVSGPSGAPLLLIGAHYDRVDKGRGATDNASGSAAVLQLAAAFKARPLQNHRVAVAFWDLEERGLLGSKAYVADPRSQKPAMYVNFDVFGWGDTLWMMRPEKELWLDAETTIAAKANAVQLSAGEMYPPTDHLAFLKASWPAVSFSLVDKAEVDGILAVLKAHGGSSGARAEMPKVMQVIHSDRDTVNELDSVDIPIALRTVEDALRAWDAANPN